jgi:hypothetical protein
VSEIQQKSKYKLTYDWTTLELVNGMRYKVKGWSEGVYSGTTNKNKLPHGIGVWTSDGGIVNEGLWKDGARHGFLR